MERTFKQRSQSSSSSGITKKQLRLKSKELKAVLQIGKDGLTPSVLSHIKTLIQRHKLIKIKLLKSFLFAQKEEMPDQTPKELAQKIADLTNAELINQVGGTVALAKKNL